MVSPEEIKKKAVNLYLRFLKAWLNGEKFFPLDIPCNKQVPEDIDIARREVTQLREQSTDERQVGYSIEWKEQNFRKHSRNPWPKRIYFPNREDFLRYLGKQREFEAFARAVTLVRQQFPQLKDWLRQYPKKLIKVANEIDGLLAVVQYLVDNPRPGCFARELPVAVRTKFVEKHHSVLRKWLDLVLPSEAVFAHEDRFERRFGLKYKGDYLPWMTATPITYWGDLDIEGLEALSTFRARLPQTQSFLMDSATLNALPDLTKPGEGKSLPEPVHLEPLELAAFVRCRDDNLRLEQEQIPQPVVLEALAKLKMI